MKLLISIVAFFVLLGLAFGMSDKLSVPMEELKDLLDGSSAVEILTFTLYDEEYEFESGMTWQEFVDSDLNTYGFTVNSEKVWIGSYEYTQYITDLYENPVSLTDEIQAQAYISMSTRAG